MSVDNSPPKYDVVGVGSLSVDEIMTVDDVMRMETIDRNGADKKYIAIEYSSKLNVKSFKTFPGGSAPNVLCDLSNVGFKTALLGAVGDDVGGDISLSDLKKHRVEFSAVKTVKGESTAHSVILITPWGRDRSILAYKGASDEFGMADAKLSDEMLKNCKCFLWSSLTSKSSIEAMEYCIDTAKATGAIIAAAPSISIIKIDRNSTIRLLKKSDITSLNDEEILALTGLLSVEEAIAMLQSWGLKTINCTLGREGSMLVVAGSGKLIKTKPPTIHVNDTTGAGDASMAGLIWGTLASMTPEDIGKVAASMSAMEIESVGVRIGMPKSDEELRSFMSYHPVEQASLQWSDRASRSASP